MRFILLTLTLVDQSEPRRANCSVSSEVYLLFNFQTSRPTPKKASVSLLAPERVQAGSRACDVQAACVTRLQLSAVKETELKIPDALRRVTTCTPSLRSLTPRSQRRDVKRHSLDLLVTQQQQQLLPLWLLLLLYCSDLWGTIC